MIVLSGEDRRLPGRDSADDFSDLSLQWLIQAQVQTLSAKGVSVNIFPFAVNYDRLFDVPDLISKNLDSFSNMKFLKMLKERIDGSLGRIYVTFGESFSLLSEISGK